MEKEVAKQFGRLQVHRLSGNNALLGHGSVVVGGVVEVCFVIRQTKEEEVYVRWPSHKSGNGKWYSDIKFPSHDVKVDLEDQILDTFEALPRDDEKKNNK